MICAYEERAVVLDEADVPDGRRYMVLRYLKSLSGDCTRRGRTYRREGSYYFAELTSARYPLLSRGQYEVRLL